MEYKDERARLYDTLIAEGLGPKEADGVHVPVPQRYKDLWIKRFFAKQEQLVFSKDARLVNRFTVGADPEFFFVNKIGNYTHAEGLGLTTLKAFGCDLAGRQAELRVAPSRFVLDLVASVTETLRWMSALVPDTRTMSWVSRPYMPNVGRADGAGGHIHLARKHVTMQTQVKSLDHATALCLGTGIFNREGFNDRVVGTVYGKWGDYRPQSFGFEYRTAPTWLASPLIAYLAIVIHKLASHHHVAIIPKDGKARVQQQVLNLFRLYRGLDDDAALALRAIQELDWPVDDPTDFKPRWGVANTAYNMNEKTYVPTVIGGSLDTKHQLFDIFNGVGKMKLTPPQCTWNPAVLPKGCYSAEVTQHIKDLPDFAMGVISYKHKVVFHAIGAGQDLLIYSPIDLDDVAIRNAVKHIGGVHVDRDNARKSFIVYIPHSVLNSNPTERKAYRDLLADPKLFPFCRMSKYEEGIFEKWDKPLVKTKIKTYGKKISEVVPDLPVGPFNFDMEAGLIPMQPQAPGIYPIPRRANHPPPPLRAPDPIRVGPAGGIARPRQHRYVDGLAQQAQVVDMAAIENRLMRDVIRQQEENIRQQQPADALRGLEEPPEFRGEFEEGGNF